MYFQVIKRIKAYQDAMAGPYLAGTYIHALTALPGKFGAVAYISDELVGCWHSDSATLLLLSCAAGSMHVAGSWRVAGTVRLPQHASARQVILCSWLDRISVISSQGADLLSAAPLRVVASSSWAGKPDRSLQVADLGHSSCAPRCAAMIAPDALACGCADGAVRVWRAQDDSTQMHLAQSFFLLGPDSQSKPIVAACSLQPAGALAGVAEPQEPAVGLDAAPVLATAAEQLCQAERARAAAGAPGIVLACADSGVYCLNAIAGMGLLEQDITAALQSPSADRRVHSVVHCPARQAVLAAHVDGQVVAWRWTCTDDGSVQWQHRAGSAASQELASTACTVLLPAGKGRTMPAASIAWGSLAVAGAEPNAWLACPAAPTPAAVFTAVPAASEAEPALVLPAVSGAPGFDPQWSAGQITPAMISAAPAGVEDTRRFGCAEQVVSSPLGHTAVLVTDAELLLIHWASDKAPVSLTAGTGASLSALLASQLQLNSAAPAGLGPWDLAVPASSQAAISQWVPGPSSQQVLCSLWYSRGQLHVAASSAVASACAQQCAAVEAPAHAADTWRIPGAGCQWLPENNAYFPARITCSSQAWAATPSDSGTRVQVHLGLIWPWASAVMPGEATFVVRSAAEGISVEGFAWQPAWPEPQRGMDIAACSSSGSSAPTWAIAQPGTAITLMPLPSTRRSSLLRSKPSPAQLQTSLQSAAASAGIAGAVSLDGPVPHITGTLQLATLQSVGAAPTTQEVACSAGVPLRVQAACFASGAALAVTAAGRDITWGVAPWPEQDGDAALRWQPAETLPCPACCSLGPNDCLALGYAHSSVLMRAALTSQKSGKRSTHVLKLQPLSLQATVHGTLTPHMAPAAASWTWLDAQVLLARTLQTAVAVYLHPTSPESTTCEFTAAAIAPAVFPHGAATAADLGWLWHVQPWHTPWPHTRSAVHLAHTEPLTRALATVAGDTAALRALDEVLLMEEDAAR